MYFLLARSIESPFSNHLFPASILEVAINMSSEIRLVQEVEKYECLYNNTLPEYNRKDLADEAWTNVSAALNLTGKCITNLLLT